MVCLVLCLSWAAPAWSQAGESTPHPADIQCRDNLQTLLHGIEKYARAHQGRYPALLSEMVPSQLKELPTCELGGPESYTLYSVLENDPSRAVLICSYPGHRLNGIDYLVLSSDRGTETPFLRVADPSTCRRALLTLGQKMQQLRDGNHTYPPKLDQMLRCSCGDPIQYWASPDGSDYQAYCPGAAHVGAGLAPFSPHISPRGLEEQNLLLSPPGTTAAPPPPPPTPTWMYLLAAASLLVIAVLALQWARPKARRLD